MLLNGVNHIGMLTNDIERLAAFYAEVFDSPPPRTVEHNDEFSLTMIDIGPYQELNVFQIDGNVEAARQTPMFGRGRLDHIGLQAADLDAFNTIRDRLIAREATDGFVTDFGPMLSLFFVDPDGLEGEVLTENPNAEPGVFHPPGTPAPGYEVVIPDWRQ
jgi:catechol 2,3-dioxygenase-like lactoylglutathione lyase family enzyme